MVQIQCIVHKQGSQEHRLCTEVVKYIHEKGHQVLVDCLVSNAESTYRGRDEIG
jgi:hypothetical protein